MGKIRNILFDFGGVIATLDLDRARESFRSLGIKDIEQYFNATCQKGPFGDLEEGKISGDEIAQTLSRMAGREVTYAQCAEAWLSIVVDVPAYKLHYLDSLRRRGYKVIMLSNTNPFIGEWMDSPSSGVDGRGISSFFDHLCLSFQMGCMKPGEEIFQKVLSSLGITAEESLFIDDGKKNVQTASSLGFSTILPLNGADWRDDIEKILKA